MKMTHRDCGGIVQASESMVYESEEYGIVPVYRCTDCGAEIMGDTQIEFLPESRSDEIQIEAILKKGTYEMKDLSEEEFKKRLIDAGWSQEEANEEWNTIQEDDESGYDGP